MGVGTLFSPKQLLKTFSDSAMGWESVQGQIHALEMAQENLATDTLSSLPQFREMLDMCDDPVLLNCLNHDLFSLFHAENNVVLPSLVSGLRQTIRLIAEKHALHELENAFGR